jgi:SCF-associated factor 1
MAGSSVSLPELPLDIILTIVPFLDVQSFISLSSTCKAFYQPTVRFNATFWSHATQSTFRVPNQPVVQGDGRRWRRMYRRLLTQSRVFAWGNNPSGCLGHKVSSRGDHLQQGHAWPEEMEGASDLGIIADLQCGYDILFDSNCFPPI